MRVRAHERAESTRESANVGSSSVCSSARIRGRTRVEKLNNLSDKLCNFGGGG